MKRGKFNASFIEESKKLKYGSALWIYYEEISVIPYLWEKQKKFL